MGRLEYIDAVKGVAILCITLLHFEAGVFPSWLNVWIGSFMVAAFYFTSGWVTGMKGMIPQPKELFFKRVRQLGIPYLWFSLLILFFDLILCLFGFMTYKILFRDIYKTLVLRGIGTLWFLPVLLFGEYLFSWVMSRKRAWSWGIALLLISLVVPYLYFKYQPLRERGDLYRILEAPIRPVVYSLKAWPVIMFGFFGGKYLTILLIRWKRSAILIGSASLLGGSLLLIFGDVNLLFLSEWLSCLLPVLGLIGFFSALPHNPMSGFFAYWGRNSLILMCLHYSILLEICKIIDLRIYCHPDFSGPFTLIYFVVSVFVTWLLIPLFKTKLKFMMVK